MFQKIYLLLQKTQGRDKLTKFLIYLFKLIDAFKSIYRNTPTYKLERIGHHFQKARQFMRLAKFIQQYSTIIKLIRQPSKDQFGRLVRIITHSIFSFYWVLDNICLLSSFNVIEIPQFQITQTAMTIKFIALAIAALLNLRSWLRLHHAQLKARRQLKYLKGQDNLKRNVQLMQLIKEQWKMFLLCVKIYGDMLPSIAKSVIAKKIFKKQIPRSVQAIGGLVNAVVSCYLTSF